MHRDIGYARLSHKDPDEAGAIARQKQDIRRVSAATGGQLVVVENHRGENVDILVDNAVSASRYARRKRKDYPLIETYARAGLIDRAVIYDVDRLLRIPRELEDLIDLVEELQGRFQVVAVNGVLDLTTADGRFFARLRVAQAAKESDDLSRRLRRQSDQRAEAGRPHGVTTGRRCFGYTPDGLGLQPDEANAVRDAATAVLTAGASLNEIARRWNTQGLVGPRAGRRWSNRTVRSVLAGHRIAGLRIHRQGKPDEKTYPAAWPAIVDEITHRALRRKLLEQPSRRPGRRTEYTGLFVAVIDEVSWPMRRDRARNVYRTFADWAGQDFPHCSIGPIDELEGMVRRLLFDFVESGAVAERVARRRATDGERTAVESAAAVQALIDQADEDEAHGVIDRRGWLTKRKVLVPRLRAAQMAESGPAPSVLDRVTLNLRVEWWDWDIDARAALLREMFDRVEVRPAAKTGRGFHPERVTPVWR